MRKITEFYKKSRLKQQNSALFLFILLILQILTLTPMVFAENSLDSSSNFHSDTIPNESLGLTHTSNYFFPVEKSSPLFQEDNSDNNTESSPKGAYAYNSDISLSIYLEKHVFTLGETVHLNIRYFEGLTPKSNVQLEISLYSSFYRDYYYYYEQPEIVPLSSKIAETNSEGIASVEFNGLDEGGIYTVMVNAEGNTEFKDFSVGDTGIFFKGARYFQLSQDYMGTLQILNINNFSPVPNATYHYEMTSYDYYTNEWQVLRVDTLTTDVDGFGIIQTRIPDNNEIYSIKLAIYANGTDAEFYTYLYRSWDYYYYTLRGGEQTANMQQYQYVVTTDKTIYTPGETVSLRALVLQYSFMNETKTILPFTDVHVTFYNPDEYAIFWQTLQTDQYGIFEYRIPLDKDASLGTYGIEFSIDNDAYRYNFKVDYYEKPAFRVMIDTGGKDFYPRENRLNPLDRIMFTGKVRAEYYFGQPVIGAQVELRLKSYRKEIQHTITGITNYNGEILFNIDLTNYDELDYTFYAEAVVIDEYDREASTQRHFTRINELYAWGYLTTWDPAPTDPIHYKFSAYQYTMQENADSSYYGYWSWNYNPLVNVSADITIYGVDDYDLGITEIKFRHKITEYQIFTNSYGMGELDFQLPLDIIEEYHLFEIRISIQLEDGRKTTSSTYFRYQKYQLSVELANENLAPGDNLDFTITFQDVMTNTNLKGQGRIYLYDAERNRLLRATLKISSSESYSLLIPEFAPSGTYSIYTYVYAPADDWFRGFEYHSDYLQFQVGESSTYSLTFNHNASSPLNIWSNPSVKLGDILQISGSTDIPTNAPVYLEIYKRGLFDIRKLNLVNDEFSLNLEITAEYGPDFTVMIYTISDSGNLYEEAQVFSINFTSGVEISTDKEIYEPGDEIKLTLTPNSDQPTLVSLSFIDSSVLDVEPEDDSELGYFNERSYYAFIGSGSSWGVGYQASSYWWFGYATDSSSYYRWGIYEESGTWALMDDSDSAEQGGQNVAPPTFDDLVSEFNTEIRKNITESTNWISKLLITENTTLTFKLPDNIGEWTIRVVSNGLNVDEPSQTNVLWGEVETIRIKSFLPFFVEWELPNPMYQDDIINIKAYIYNYLGTDANVAVALDAGDLTILNRPTQEIFVPNNYVSEVEFSVYCNKAFSQEITIIAAANASNIIASDGKQLEAYIYPKGIEVNQRNIGFLNSSNSQNILNLTVDAATIDIESLLSIHTQYLDISLDSWQSLIGYPYGCVEQTISKLLPTALVYNYLNVSDNLTEKWATNMEMMILEGLSRIYSFQQSDGGWGWWHGDSSQIQMTAIAFSALLEVEAAGFQVNEEVISAASDFLINQQENAGFWQFDYYTNNNFEATAYIVKALISKPNRTTQENLTISKALTYLETNWGQSDLQSPYGASLWYLALTSGTYGNAVIESDLITYLLDTKQQIGSNIYWQRPEEGWYWYNLGSTVEITSYVVQALSIDGYFEHYHLIQKAINFILNRRSRWGWWSTADSAAAITMFTVLNDLAGEHQVINYTGGINVYINSELVRNLTISSDTWQPDEIQLDLSKYLHAGENLVSLELTGEGTLSYLLDQTQIIRYNPAVTIASTKNSETSEINYTLAIDNIPKSLYLANISVELKQLPEEAQILGENYSFFENRIENNYLQQFKIESIASFEEDMTPPYFSIQGEVHYDTSTNSEVNELDYQSIEWQSTPLGISEEIVNLNLNYQYLQSIPLRKSSLNSQGIQPQASSKGETSANDISLDKSISNEEGFQPGKMLDIHININNDGEFHQYYALDDYIPAGTIFIEESIEMSGNIPIEDIILETRGDQLHFFIPALENGELEINYQVQIEKLKFTKIEGCKLWGMYDNFELETDPIVLARLPKMFDFQNQIFSDELIPSLSQAVESKQLSSTETPSVEFRVAVTDNIAIEKIKILYSDGNAWAARNFYITAPKELYVLTLDNLPDGDYKLEYIIEVWDIFGNILTLQSDRITVLSVHVPYLQIGVLIGLSMGLAMVATKFANKNWKKQNLPSISFDETQL